MDLVTFTLTLPLAPLRGVLAIARLLQDEANRELYDTSRVRRELEEIDRARAEDGLADEAAQGAEEQIVSRLTQGPTTRQGGT